MAKKSIRNYICKMKGYGVMILKGASTGEIFNCVLSGGD